MNDGVRREVGVYHKNIKGLCLLFIDSNKVILNQTRHPRTYPAETFESSIIRYINYLNPHPELLSTLLGVYYCK